jgi:hypothetical protein
MKKILILAIVLVFFLAVPFAAMSADMVAAGKSGGGSSTTFAVVNPNHTQVLGGNSTNATSASGGLANAAAHSQAVVAVNGDGGKGTGHSKGK